MPLKYKILLAIFTPVLPILLFSKCESKIEKNENYSCYKFTEKNIIYYKTNETGDFSEIILKDANPQNFSVIQNNNPKNTCLNADIWGKDKMNVYFKEKKLKGADPQTFKVLGYSYSADYNKVYFKENFIPNIKPANIKILGNYYIKDNNKVLFCGKETSGIKHVESFEIIDGYFAKDSVYIYQINETSFLPVEKANIRYFEELNTYDSILNSNIKLYSDSNKVFVFEIFENKSKKNTLHFFYTKTDSFKIFNDNNYIKADNKIYFDKIQIKDADPKTFKIIGEKYSADKNYIYFQNNKIAQNSSHFKLINTQKFDAQDSIYYYKEGIQTQKEQNNIK